MSFNLELNKMEQLITYRTLTLYHTMPTLNDPEDDGFRKDFGQRGKAL